MTPGIKSINLGRQAAVEIFDAINRVPEIDAWSDDDGVKLENFKGSLELKRIAFAYPSRPNQLVFNGLQLKIDAGTSIALVGPSGSRKSTISKLLLRLYDPMGGEVLADGVPMKDVNLKWWRSQIGYVPQELSLFPGSIEKIFPWASLRRVAPQRTKRWSRRPRRYFWTKLHRLWIVSQNRPCRMPLTISVSFLCPSSRARIFLCFSLNRFLDVTGAVKKITTVTVAHRLSTIISSDQIAVLSDGLIEEIGTHQSLLEAGGIYASLCKAQGITTASPRESLTTTAEATGGVPEQATSGDISSREEPKKPSGDEEDIEAANGTIDGAKSKSKKDTEDTPKMEETAPMSRLWEYNKPEWAYMFLGVFGGCVVGVLPAFEGVLFAQLTANFFQLDSDGIREENFSLSLVFLGLAGASLLGNMALGAGFSVSGFRLTRRMRVLVFDRIMRHSIGWFDYKEHSTGKLTSRLEEDAKAVAKVTGWSLGQQIQVIASLTSGCIISLVFSWQIGLIAIACLPWIMFAAFVEAKCSKYTVVDQEGLSAATILEQGLREISLVHEYNLQKDVSDKYSDALQPEMADKIRRGKIAGFVFGFSQFAIFCTFALIFYCGIQFMLQGVVTFGDFFTSLLVVMFSALSAGQVNADFNSRHKGLACGGSPHLCDCGRTSR
jgi:ATP-binding cassette subfamily B (MDR/TAP) protein 1